MVEVSVPIEAAPMPPNVHPWIKWIAEPRHASLVLGVLHLVLVVAGVAAVLIPDDNGYNHALGPSTADVWGVLLILGGGLGATGALPGWWYLEQVGLWIEVVGVGLWVAALWMAQLDPPSVSTYRTCLALALALMLAHRYLRIDGAGLDPRRATGAPCPYR